VKNWFQASAFTCNSYRYIKSLHRWKRIGLIRELSGAATADKNAEHAGMSRFARSLRVVGLGQFSRYFAVKTHSIDDSQYSPRNQTDTRE
jgi:hypothetical protein